MAIQRITDGLARWSVIAIAALLPIFIVPVSWVTVAQAKLVLVAALIFVALIAWLLARLLDGFALVPRNFLLFAGALLPIAYGVSAFVTGGAWTSLVGSTVAQDTVVVICIWYALLVLVSFSLTKNPRSLVNVLRAFILGSTVLVVFQVGRLFFPEALSLGGYLSGNSSSIFGSWHDLGILAGMLVFLALALWDTPVAWNIFWKFVLVVLGVGSFLLLLVVNSVDVWYALVGLFVVFGLYRFLALRREGASGGRLMTRTVLWLALALVAGAAGYFSSNIYTRLPAQLQIVQLEVRPSWQGTYLIGQKVFTTPRTLLFGSGPNTFTREWGLFKPAGVNQTDFWNIDFNAGVGFIPTTFVTTGLVGLIAWGILLLALLWSIIRFLWGKGEASVRTTLAAALATAAYIAAFQIMYVPGVALSALLFLFLGIIVELESAEESREPILLSLRPASLSGATAMVLTVVIVGLFALAPFTAVRASTSDLLVQRAAAVYSATGSIEQSLILVQQAIAVFPQSDIAQRAAVEVGLLQLSKIVAAGTDDSDAQKKLKDHLETTISHGLAAVSIDSGDYQNWLELAFLYQNLAGVGTQGAYENAKAAYEKSSIENPTNPLPHVRIAQLALTQGDSETALDHLNKAIALKPNLAAAYYLRSQIEAAQGTYAQGIQDAAAAAQLAPQDATAWYNLGAILFTANSFDLARQALEKAVSLQNNYANAIFVLSLSYDKLGRGADALAAMQAVKQLNPSDATVLQAVENLQAGKPALSPAQEPKRSK